MRLSKVVEKLKGNETGMTVIETLIAMVILGLVVSAFLGSLATASKTTGISNERAIAESLVRSEIEYVKNCTYQYLASEYPLNPDLSVPTGWTVPPATVELVHGSDDGIQKVTITAEHNGEAVLSVEIYKADR